MFWKMFIDTNAHKKIANRVAQSAVPVSDARDKDGGVVESGFHMQVLARADHAWDRTRYEQYSGGRPEISVVRICLPPCRTMDWHKHSVHSAAYVLAGDLTVETRDGISTHFRAGDALLGTVDIWHRGRAGRFGVELMVFYAGSSGLPLTIPLQPAGE
ncbi:cupin domain-containing protein [Burkholderia cepacia]|uniref:cupin domain-containing protein n=1 Tax=Burkholderia cepacia TaxID=292 RepID=UPI0012970F1E|nr:cupin domain-containing protein [Burkholderia cepacia]